MAYDSIVQTGSFTADGNNKTLKIRSDVDKIVIENITQWAATNNGYGVRYTWYRDMGTTGLMEYHPAADHTLAVNTTASAFEIIDSSDYTLGAWVSVTAGTNVVGPVYSTADTSGLADGCIVRIKSTNHDNLNGIDFSIDSLVTNTSFALANDLATAPGRVAGANGYYRLVAPDIETYNLFAPSYRYITNITQAASAVVTTSVDHGYAIGQRIKFKVPSGYGMTELNNQAGVISAVTTSTFTVDIDTSGYTAFAFPTYDDVPFDYALATPAGDGKTATTAPGKVYNQGYIGLILTGGTTGPAGNNADVIRWTAYKAVADTNE